MKVFIDLNSNGIRDALDKPLGGVQILVQDKAYKTNASGEITMDSITATKKLEAKLIPCLCHYQ